MAETQKSVALVLKWQAALRQKRQAEKRMRRAKSDIELRTAAVTLSEAEHAVETARAAYQEANGG